MIAYSGGIQFLSRLFGGEENVDYDVTVPTFLSRLFGGEVDELKSDVENQFLSRLFGGEVHTF